MSLALASDRYPEDDAATEFAEINRFLARRRQTVLDLLGPEPEPGAHYPEGEVWDSVTQAQFFFHRHAGSGREPDEVGHFHCFIGGRGIPSSVTPLILPEMVVALVRAPTVQCVATHRTRADRGVFCHIAGISIDRLGRPIGLFTTNRWVTGETWFRAEDVARLLPLFRFEDEAVDPVGQLMGRWLASLLASMRPELVRLLQGRDTAIMHWRQRRTRRIHVFDDRRLDVTSRTRIDLNEWAGISR